MKRIIILPLFCLMLAACNQPKATTEKSGEEPKDTIIQKPTVKKQDKPVSQYTKEELAPYLEEKKSGSQTFIQPKGITQNTNGLYCYFQLRNGKGTALRFHIQYWSEKYANVDSYVYNADGKKYSFIANKSQSGGNDPRFEGSTFYWYDEDVDKSDLAFLNAIAKGKEVTVSLVDRGVNETIETITLTDQEKLNVHRTLEYYYALDGALIPKKGMVNIRR